MAENIIRAASDAAASVDAAAAEAATGITITGFLVEETTGDTADRGVSATG